MASPVDLIEVAIELTRDFNSVELKLKELQDSYNKDYMQIAAEVELQEGKDENADLVAYYEKHEKEQKHTIEIANLAIKRLLTRNWYQRLLNHL